MFKYNLYKTVRAVGVGTTTVYFEIYSGGQYIDDSVEVTIPPVGPPVRVNKTGGVDVRGTASASGTLVGRFANGAMLSLIDETPQNDMWYNVSGTSTTGATISGWVSGLWLEKEIHIVTANGTGIHVRIGPGGAAYYSSAGQVDTGFVATLIDENAVTGYGYTANGVDRNDWYKIQYNASERYVAAAYFIKSSIWEALASGGVIVPTSVSSNGIMFIADYEQFRSTPYDDGSSYMTIGYGHRILPGESFTSITQAEGYALFASDLATREVYVTNLLISKGGNWTQNQYDALVSLYFNAGTWMNGVLNDILNGMDPYDAFYQIKKSDGIVLC